MSSHDLLSQSSLDTKTNSDLGAKMNYVLILLVDIQIVSRPLWKKSIFSENKARRREKRRRYCCFQRGSFGRAAGGRQDNHRGKPKEMMKFSGRERLRAGAHTLCLSRERGRAFQSSIRKWKQRNETGNGRGRWITGKFLGKERYDLHTDLDG